MSNHSSEKFILGSGKHRNSQCSALIILESLLRPMESQCSMLRSSGSIRHTTIDKEPDWNVGSSLCLVKRKQREVRKDHRSALQCPGIRPTLSSRSKDLRRMYLSHRGKNSGMRTTRSARESRQYLLSSALPRAAESRRLGLFYALLKAISRACPCLLGHCVTRVAG